VSNRSEKSLADAIGPFSAIIVVRVLVARGLRGVELLRRVSDSVRQALSNAALPPQMFGRCVDGKSGAAFGSRFQVTYNHHNYPRHPENWDGLRLIELPADFNHIKADLVLHSWFEGERLCCALAFYTGILTTSSVAALADELRSIVAKLVGRQ
jgi:hypothetical protein